MKISTLIGVIAALVVAGGAFYWVQSGMPHTELSASAANSAASTTAADGSLAFVCDNGAQVKVTPSADASSVVVADNSGASQSSLTLTRSPDGTSWSGSGLTLTGSGNTIVLSGSGEQTTCTPVQPQ